MRRFTYTLLLAALALPCATQLQAQSEEDLAKQLANPLASLISVPLQFNHDTGHGAEGADRNYLNVQPVIPFTLNPDWNLISRTIIPINSRDAYYALGDSVDGIGDIVQSLWASPSTSGIPGVTWGLGAAFLLPTATDPRLGAEKWGAGPTIVALKQAGPWTVGALANHIWSFAGDPDRDEVNASFVQPFVNYTLPTGTTLFLNTESTYDWNAAQWNAPLNFGVNQVLALGQQKIQIGAGARYWMDAPEAGANGWGARVNLVFLFPK